MKTFLKKNSCTPSKMEKGWGNGYVALPRRHPYFGLGYDEINEKLEHLKHYVHGGITIAIHSSKIECEEAKDMDDMWVVGWDTAHFGDTIELWPKERVLKENEMLSVFLVKAWNEDIKRQSNEIESFIDKLHNNLI